MKQVLCIFFSLFVLGTSVLLASALARSLSDSAAAVTGAETRKIAVYQNKCTGQIQGVLVRSGNFCPRYLGVDREYELVEFRFCGVVIPVEKLFARQDIFASYATLVDDKKE